MIDAIRTSLQGATALRAEASQPALGSAQQDADPQEHVQSELEAQRYYSPVVRLDPEAQRIVLQYRDANTGKVIMQYPSEKQLEAYRNRNAAAAKSQGEQEASQNAFGHEAPVARGSRSGETPDTHRTDPASVVQGHPEQGVPGVGDRPSAPAPTEQRATVAEHRPSSMVVTA